MGWEGEWGGDGGHAGIQPDSDDLSQDLYRVSPG